MDDPERAFVPFFPFDDYVLLVNNMRGTSTLGMYAIADETLLQLSRFILSPFNPAAF
jgi:dihydroxyacetone kinase